MNDWPIGLSTGCFYNTSIFDCLETILRAGFGMIEICSFPAHLDYHDSDAVARAARLVQDLGLEAYSFHAPFADSIDITALDDQSRNHAREEILRAAEAAAAMEVRYFVIHPGPEKGGFPESERFDRMENAASVLDEVSERCGELGIGFVLENMLPHLFTGHVRELLWILGSLKTADLGVCLDTGHAHLSGNWSNVAKKLSGHLWMVHANDNKGEHDDHLSPGDGQIDWMPLLRQLSRIGFTGAMILELSGKPDVDTILEGARRGRRFLRYMARRLEVYIDESNRRSTER
jgi:sugar phosphate isomerase/epimerase